MTLLLENPLPGLVIGAVLVTLAAIVYSSLRTTWSLVALSVAVALCGGLVAIEWLIETPREQAEQVMGELLNAVEANDLAGVLANLSPTATTVAADANRLMPQFDIEKANRVGSLRITLDDPTNPHTADVECRVFVSARHRRSGAKGGDLADITFHFVRSGERWLLEDYSGSEEWRRGAAQLRSGR